MGKNRIELVAFLDRAPNGFKIAFQLTGFSTSRNASLPSFAVNTKYLLTYQVRDFRLIVPS
jgi:hypothetical protein